MIVPRRLLDGFVQEEILLPQLFVMKFVEIVFELQENYVTMEMQSC